MEFKSESFIPKYKFSHQFHNQNPFVSFPKTHIFEDQFHGSTNPIKLKILGVRNQCLCMRVNYNGDTGSLDSGVLHIHMKIKERELRKRSRDEAVEKRRIGKRE